MYLYFLLQLPGQSVGLYLEIIMKSSLRISPGRITGIFSSMVGSSLLLVIIDDFDIICISLMPIKTYAPPVIDADAVLAIPFSARGLQMVSRWSAKGIQAGRSIQRGQFAYDNPLNIGRQFREAPLGCGDLF